jgi:hypothetical protein
MACTAILLIAALAASPALVGAHRNWQSTSDSVASALVRDGRAARLVLQKAARRASLQSLTIAPDGHWIDLPYYDSPDSAEVDRYARLSWSDGCLSLREGLIDEHGTKQMLTDTVVCDDVSDCVFTQSGASVRMKLTLTEGATQMTVVAAAMTNNK